MEMLTISDLQSMRLTCRHLRAVALAVIRRRIRFLLDPYVPSYFTEFIRTLRLSGAVITGSVARAMICGQRGTSPHNLNIVVPYTSFQLFHTFIKHVLGYIPISTKAHPAIAHAVYRFRKYVCHERVITLSAARPSQSVLQIILNAPTTADMVVMSAGGVAWFYPRWLRDAIAVRTHSSRFVPSGDKLGCDIDLTQEIRLEEDLEFTQIPCGPSCPTLWHHVEDTTLRSFVDWDVDDTVTQVFNEVDIEWRLSPDCTNTRCRYRVDVMYRNLYTNGAFNRELFLACDYKLIHRSLTLML